MAATRKYFNGALKSVDSASRRIVGLAYPPQLDRDGETIKPSAFSERGLDSFRKKPTLQWAHDYKGLPIGVVTDIRSTANGPEFEAQFFDHEEAAKVWKIYEYCASAGIPVPLGVSIGFMPISWSDEKVYPTQRGRTYTEVELLEISIVPVPSNSAALAQARSKGLDVEIIDVAIKAVEDSDAARLIAIEAILNAILGGAPALRYAREAMMIAWNLHTDTSYDRLVTAIDHDIVTHLYYILAEDSDPMEHARAALALIARLRGEKPATAMMTEQPAEPIAAEEARAAAPNIIPADQIDTQIKTLRNEALNRMEQLKLILKEGRVLSAANRELLTNCVTQLNEAIRVMQDLLDATDTTRPYSLLSDLSAELVQSISENTDISTRMAALLVRGYETTTGAAVTTEPTDTHGGRHAGYDHDHTGER